MVQLGKVTILVTPNYHIGSVPLSSLQLFVCEKFSMKLANRKLHDLDDNCK